MRKLISEIIKNFFDDSAKTIIDLDIILENAIRDHNKSIKLFAKNSIEISTLKYNTKKAKVKA